MAATSEFPLVKSITDLFVLGPGKTTPNGTFVPPPLLMGFTHEYVAMQCIDTLLIKFNVHLFSNDITPIIAVLGLFNESSYAPLNPTRPNPARKFRSSFIVPFRGTVALERMSCVLPAHLATPTIVHHVPGTLPSGLPTSQFVRVKVRPIYRIHISASIHLTD